jgi:hypothetical protein
MYGNGATLRGRPASQAQDEEGGMVQSGIDQLREQVRGAVITPDDEGYE